MAFNPPQGNEDFTPYIKYDARAGRWLYRKPGEKTDLEIQHPTFHIDLANIQSGWQQFVAGMGPMRTPDPRLGVMAEKPSPDHKRGFWVKLWSPELGVREFASCANAVTGAIGQLYAMFEAEKGKHPGCVPIVQCVRVVPVKSGQSTNYAPVFEIRGWGPGTVFEPFHRVHPANGQSSAPARPPQPPAQQQAGSPAERAWAAWKVFASDLDPRNHGAAFQKSFSDYFPGVPYNPKALVDWDQWVRDGFKRPVQNQDADLPPELAPAGTVMPESEIPF